MLISTLRVEISIPRDKRNVLALKVQDTENQSKTAIMRFSFNENLTGVVETLVGSKRKTCFPISNGVLDLEMSTQRVSYKSLLSA